MRTTTTNIEGCLYSNCHRWHFYFHSLVPRPSRGKREKAWYRLHAHAPNIPQILGDPLTHGNCRILYCKLLVFYLTMSVLRIELNRPGRMTWSGCGLGYFNLLCVHVQSTLRLTFYRHTFECHYNTCGLFNIHEVPFAKTTRRVCVTTNYCYTW